jgi:hypothetical protein
MGNGRRRRRQGDRYYTRAFIGYASQDMAVDIAVGEALEHKGYGLIRSQLEEQRSAHSWKSHLALKNLVPSSCLWVDDSRSPH